MKKTNKISLIIIATAILATSGLLIYVLTNKPDKDRPKTNTNMVKEEEKTSTDESSASMEYSDVVSVSLESKQAELYFKNPGTSGTNMVLEIVAYVNDKEIVIAKSDKIEPGYVVHAIDLNDNITIPKGKFKGIFRAKYYNPTSDEQELVGSQIEINITIK